MPDGSIWEVGRFSLNGTRKWTSIGFNASFAQAPRVFLTAQTANGTDVVTVRAKAVTTDGFKAALFEQDSKNGSGHTAETVGYLAIVSPTGGGAVALAGKPVNYTVSSAVVYSRFKGVAGHSIKLEEEKSQDAETGHTGETVAVLTVDGHIFAQDTTSIGRDTVAIRRNSATPASSPTTTTGTYFIHADHLNTPQVITDDAHDTVWRAEYTPFGQANITTEVITNNLRFPGQYYDSETGLHYNYFRDYDPSIGRYVQSDPIGLAGGINTFAYVGGNPLYWSDPTGLIPPGWWKRNAPLPDYSDWPIDPTSEGHTRRNRHNRCPWTPPKKDCDGKYRDKDGNEWNKDPWYASVYHGSLQSYSSYRNPSDGSQCTYHPSGLLIDSGPYLGTYDYKNPGKDGFFPHNDYDIRPHQENPNYQPALTGKY